MFKKIICLLLTLNLVSCANAPPVNTEEEQAKFSTYMDEEFIEYLESDAVNLHFVLEDTSVYDLDLPEQTLGEISEAYFNEVVQVNQDSLDKLMLIERRGLTDEQMKAYDIYKRDLTDGIESSKYFLNDNLFAPSTGVTNNLLTVLMEYRFDETNDVDNYILLVDDVGRYLDDAMAFTQMQIDQGYFMNDFTVDATVESIDRFTSKIDDNQLIISFNDKIMEMDIESKEELMEKNEKLVKEVVLPAYQKVKDFLLLNKDTRVISGGSSVLPNGKEYYSNLVKMKTSSNLKVEKLIEMSMDYLNEKIVNVQKIIAENDDVLKEYTEFKLESQDPSVILKELQKNTPQRFPQGPEVSYNATYLDSSIADKAVVAYYLIPPIDNTNNNTIKINGDNIGEGLSLYTTLAHEGFPGHLYQTTYLFNQDIHPLMMQLNYIGYTEGWATYTELEALEWIEFENPLTAELIKFDTQYGFIMQGVIDMGVNYLGWDVAKVDEILGLGEETAQEIYESVISEPGQILPYGMGLVFFDTYRSEAESELKDKFNEVEFNEVLLSNGYRSFEEVKKDVDEYVKENK